MPNDETKRTKSELKSETIRRWTVRTFIVLAAVAGLTLLFRRVETDQEVISLHRHTYHVQVMRTEAELEHGLSDSKALAADQAMLFVFPFDGEQSMWMKDMNYPIDMVWLNDAKEVVHLQKNAEPSSYDKADPNKSTLFKSDIPARYVIELPSGTIERTGIISGDPAGFPSGI